MGIGEGGPPGGRYREMIEGGTEMPEKHITHDVVEGYPAQTKAERSVQTK